MITYYSSIMESGDTPEIDHKQLRNDLRHTTPESPLLPIPPTQLDNRDWLNWAMEDRNFSPATPPTEVQPALSWITAGYAGIQDGDKRTPETHPAILTALGILPTNLKSYLIKMGYNLHTNKFLSPSALNKISTILLDATIKAFSTQKAAMHRSLYGGFREPSGKLLALLDRRTRRNQWNKNIQPVGDPELKDHIPQDNMTRSPTNLPTMAPTHAQTEQNPADIRTWLAVATTPTEPKRTDTRNPKPILVQQMAQEPNTTCTSPGKRTRQNRTPRRQLKKDLDTQNVNPNTTMTPANTPTTGMMLAPMPRTPRNGAPKTLPLKQPPPPHKLTPNNPPPLIHPSPTRT